MTKNAQRLSQLISTFGPGAMIDLPTRSVVVGGLEQWDMKGDAFRTIPEPRLAMRLELLLKEQNRLDPAATLSLRTPPISADGYKGVHRGIAAPVFPTWFVCEQADTVAVGTRTVRRRRLVRWRDLDAKGRRRFIFDDGRKSDVTPIRFVCACEKGHLQDIDWRWVVHGTAHCEEPMWIEEKGTSADPADTNIVCGCGLSLSLQETFQPGRLGKCRGERPWLLDRDPDGCGDNLKLLTRTATNTYFPQVYTVISLPSEEDELSRLVDELLASWVSFSQSPTSRRRSASIQRSLRPSVPMPMRTFSSACSVFGKGRRSTETGLRSCRNSTCSQAGERKSAKTCRRQNFTRRPFLAMHGPIRRPGSTSRSSRTLWRCIGYGRYPAFTGLRASKRRRPRPTAKSKISSWLFVAHPSRATRPGCRRLNNSARGFSYTSTKRPSSNGCRRRRRNNETRSSSPDTAIGNGIWAAKRLHIPARRMSCSTAFHMRSWPRSLSSAVIRRAR